MYVILFINHACYFINYACYFIYKHRCKCEIFEEGKRDKEKKLKFYIVIRKRRKKNGRE